MKNNNIKVFGNGKARIKSLKRFLAAEGAQRQLVTLKSMLDKKLLRNQQLSKNC